MFALFVVSGVVGSTTLACLAPRSKYQKHLEMLAAILFIMALASIGAGLSARLCI